MKVAVFPGSFDPITVGHEAIVKRAAPLFDKIILAIGVNSSKKYMFTLEQRMEALQACFKDYDHVVVDQYEGLTIEYCKKINAQYILRGLRIAADFEYERNIALMNRSMNDQVETLFLISQPEYSAITSTVVRDILRNGGDISQFVPESFPFK
ncbi:pantetheine-phosphate adenylyltransferase [bacterium SCSIO 12741]|nr:pantetheine-phosphate adenylyltransferase [bacterium SCSIO 12741]